MGATNQVVKNRQSPMNYRAMYREVLADGKERLHTFWIGSHADRSAAFAWAQSHVSHCGWAVQSVGAA